ncbi:hypothetical protein VCHA37P200_20050 [Vibrio chagasii]|nr:hypothetical protein VCHA34P117_150051 [Vibrio chagasii]CAH6826409.1 hypothetical protein VCHA36O157_180037 [Vibrio chagasii]CAH6857796.1 hypothetical protein VCHA34P115_210049 [Vibrio chagasii]CAH6882385.1 hypothetical protein VCHA36P164_20050 [Vibrio chagasii]CAH6893574.1 hypothetical protein VCHA32O87_20301 [Vibrio chagasii]
MIRVFNLPTVDKNNVRTKTNLCKKLAPQLLLVESYTQSISSKVTEFGNFNTLHGYPQFSTR